MVRRSQETTGLMGEPIVNVGVFPIPFSPPQCYCYPYFSRIGLFLLGARGCWDLVLLAVFWKVHYFDMYGLESDDDFHSGCQNAS